MSSRAPRWPWYYHLLLIVFSFAVPYFWVKLRPGDNEARIGFAIVCVLLAAALAAIQWQKWKRRRSDT